MIEKSAVLGLRSEEKIILSEVFPDKLGQLIYLFTNCAKDIYFKDIKRHYLNLIPVNIVLIYQLEKNECSSNPCKHRGVCKDGIGSYTCKCANDSGFTGKNCNTGIS